MSLMKWSSRQQLENIRRDMEKLFEEFMEPFPTRKRHRWWPRMVESGAFVPNIEMCNRKGNILVRVEIPGMDKEDIDLAITHDTLTVRGELKKPEGIRDEDYFLSEITYGSFLRTISLPSGVDSEKAKAVFKNGVLEIILPKFEEAKPKEIKVDVS